MRSRRPHDDARFVRRSRPLRVHGDLPAQPQPEYGSSTLRAGGCPARPLGVAAGTPWRARGESRRHGGAADHGSGRQPLVLRGRCACTAVGFEVSDEFVAAFNCHCSNCRALTGSAFLPWGEIEREKLRVTRGAGSLAVVGEADAHHAMRCRECGSLLYWTARAAHLFAFRTDHSSTSRPSSRLLTCSSARRLRGTRSSTTFHSTTSTPGPDLATSSARREPADQPSEQQPCLRRQRNVGRHADDDADSHADCCTEDDGPEVSAITGCSARHRKPILVQRDLPRQSMSTRSGRVGVEPPFTGWRPVPSREVARASSSSEDRRSWRDEKCVGSTELGHEPERAARTAYFPQQTGRGARDAEGRARVHPPA